MVSSPAGGETMWKPHKPPTDRASHKLQMVFLVRSLTPVIILRKKIRNYRINTQFWLVIWHKTVQIWKEKHISLDCDNCYYLYCDFTEPDSVIFFLLLSVHTADSRIKVKREPKSRVIFLLVHTVIARSHKRKVPIKPKKPFSLDYHRVSLTLRWSPLWIPNFTLNSTSLHFRLG